jgi:tetratricopeptide (TPR) repeat protein
LRRITLIFFFLHAVSIFRSQNKIPVDGRYIQYQNLLHSVETDSAKCARLISYGEKIMDSLGDYKFSLLIFEKTDALLHQKELKSLMPVLYSKWGYCLYQKGDFKAADKLFTKALSYTEILNTNPELKAEVFNRAGIALEKLGVYKRALFYYNEALELYTKLNNEKGKVMLYSNIASLFTATGVQVKSDEFFDKAAKVYFESGRMDRYAAVMANKAIAQIRLGDLKKARSLFLYALRTNPPGNEQFYIHTCFNLGALYSDLKQHDSCRYFLNRGKKVSDSLNLSERFNGNYYIGMGYCYLNENNISKAIVYHKLALKNKEGIHNYRAIYDDISDLYYKQKQYDSALIYKNEGMRIADSIYKSELSEHINFENKRIELLEKDYQNQIKATEQQLFLDNLKKRNFVLLSLMIMLIAFVLLFLLYFKQYKLRVKKEQLQSELDFLKAQLNPHFLFNSLNNIYVLLDQDKNKAMILLVQFCELMRYQLYDCNVSYIPLKEELKFLENYIDFEKLRYERKITVEHNLQEPVTGSLQIAPILLQPFIENAFKHTPKSRHEPGRIVIHMELTDTRFFMEIKNPVGLKERSTLPGGIGLENVKKRLKLLYPNRYKLKIAAGDTFFQVQLKITLSND